MLQGPLVMTTVCSSNLHFNDTLTQSIVYSVITAISQLLVLVLDTDTKTRVAIKVMCVCVCLCPLWTSWTVWVWLQMSDGRSCLHKQTFPLTDVAGDCLSHRVHFLHTQTRERDNMRQTRKLKAWYIKKKSLHERKIVSWSALKWDLQYSSSLVADVVWMDHKPHSFFLIFWQWQANLTHQKMKLYIVLQWRDEVAMEEQVERTFDYWGLFCYN